MFLANTSVSERSENCRKNAKSKFSRSRFVSTVFQRRICGWENNVYDTMEMKTVRVLDSPRVFSPHPFLNFQKYHRFPISDGFFFRGKRDDRPFDLKKKPYIIKSPPWIFGQNCHCPPSVKKKIND